MAEKLEANRLVPIRVENLKSGDVVKSEVSNDTATVTLTMAGSGMHDPAIADDAVVVFYRERSLDVYERGTYLTVERPHRRLPTEADVAEAIERTKREIEEDIEDGRVPLDVADFSDLHRYTDANTYGGLVDDDNPIDWLTGLGEGGPTHPVNRVVDAVDAWLKSTLAEREEQVKREEEREPVNAPKTPEQELEEVAEQMERSGHWSTTPRTGVEVTRNGYGIHIGTWSQGVLSDLTEEQAHELHAKLTEVLAYGDTDEQAAADEEEADIRDEQAINMAEVVRILREVHGITNAEVQDTGGGCQTIYAGPTEEVADYGTRYALCAGPGGIYGGAPLGWVEEFCWGNDDEDMTDAVYAKDVCANPADEAEVARLMAEFVAAKVAALDVMEGIEPITQEELEHAEGVACFRCGADATIVRSGVAYCAEHDPAPSLPQGLPQGLIAHADVDIALLRQITED